MRAEGGGGGGGGLYVAFGLPKPLGVTGFQIGGG